MGTLIKTLYERSNIKNGFRIIFILNPQNKNNNKKSISIYVVWCYNMLVEIVQRCFEFCYTHICGFWSKKLYYKAYKFILQNVTKLIAFSYMFYMQLGII